MTTQIYFASNKLGAITNHQLQLMLDRFSLGTLISSEKTALGIMGQTMNVSSSTGDYILKGNPLFFGQFLEERFFVDHLHQHTTLQVPSPYLIDETEDIFGWNYSIMPRLPGIHMNAPDIQPFLTTTEDKEHLAELMANTLVELHHWKVAQFGEFDPLTRTVRPFEGSYRTWLYSTIRYWINDATKYSIITAQDLIWVEHILQSSQNVFDDLHFPTFVMGDFKPENFLIHKHNDEWTISGIFDFTTSYFGDGLADLPKITTMYLENGEEALARKFLSSYVNSTEHQTFRDRFRVHMLHNCALVWGCAKATQQVTWDEELSFAEWAKRYTEFSI
ncbi:phosphotransferase family protein [Paenibacillus macquariensis]|uniref:Phosphotransferase enzyme family protein n=1 Tax=Paenibacillus macquariensis TaxID=948756 RepID=A0ABY1K084_9BACL|nr:aminoglycoside phosphotransferase family protein [Paenibacillus macquariensis]MEC0091464.1 aminoglycoside phosphotransferase family protein [Paenibacillus macquariensis]OAB38143.1 phosphotransferase [Paenibacillus macquariensis subsp. macquariensis]SIR07307.1 Phosphotransferase enzyme family protein [Paenibacillus macquariensis]